MGDAAARIGDPMDCGDVIAQGSGNVFANNIPISRKDDFTAGHCYSPVPLQTPPQGSVYANNKLVAIVGTPHPGHCCGPSCHPGAVAAGSGDVFIEA